MGVPKFYRWLSERYPCINENINQNNMPEFDNFYVDMNGVFHICSHPSDDVHFRIPESKIFENIGRYVDFLFHLVQPRKVFFLSVDGVAPRSKMNQQRSRRFKSAKEAIEKETKARQMGEILPTDPRFDSNCITPGTEFMYKLHLFMLDFLAKKIQNYQEWREVEVIYSGYDVPGEGEHKIMDYIRYCKTHFTLEPDTRHCLYGLDADLINLGLSTHEPYFSVLREEVQFGKNSRRHCDPIQTNFQLLHLSILRSYIYHEFHDLESKLSFEFNLEKIIDDWILVNFLVGNDFLPHVPKFHINKNGVQILYNAYKAILPHLDGYLNDAGKLVLPRYKKFLEKLSGDDLDLFNQDSINLKYLDEMNEITFGSGIDLSTDFDFEKIETEDEIVSETSSCSDSDESNLYDDEFTMHKNNYYTSKLHFKDLSTEIPKIAEEYIKGIQWVLHYYFDGCVSWNWYYPYHYAPYVSDLAKIDPNKEFHFQMSEPFPPLVQLLGVLPQASKNFLPQAFQKLTYFKDSPLIEYFPDEFKTDLNEKIHDYEAIILIPFMDEKKLLSAYEMCKLGLTPEEIIRNTFGAHHQMKYSEEPVSPIESYDLEKFPNVLDIKIPIDRFILPREIIFKGLRMNIDLNCVNGFPSLNGIPYTVKVDKARIKVFEFESQNPTMMIHVKQRQILNSECQKIAQDCISRIVYINWPLVSEAKLVAIVDSESIYLKDKIVPILEPEFLLAQTSSRNYCVLMRNRKGIVLEKVEAMAKVLPLECQRYIVTGGKVVLHKEWSTKPVYVPIDLTILDVPISNRQLPIHKSLHSIFSKNQSYYLISNPYYGYKAQIVRYIAKENMVSANVRVTSEPDFSEISDQSNYIMSENYIPERKMAIMVKKEVKIPENIVKRLLGSVLTMYETNKGRVKRFNIGLKLKYKNNSQQYCVPGYSCICDGEIYYNRKVIQVFHDYHRTFPFIFEMLQKLNKPTYEIDDLNVALEIGKSEKIKLLISVKDWLDQQEFSKIGHTLADAEYLDNCIVKAIEERIESHMVLMNEENIIPQKFPPQNFYIPEFVLKGQYLPDPKVKYFLFDRVVNVKTAISPPFGLKGTVIGIYRSQDQLKKYRESQANNANEDETDETLINSVIEVLFDEPFDGGLGDRSSKTNVFKMNASWLINISYGLITSKRSMNFKNVYQAIQPSRGSGYHYNHDNNKRSQMELNGGFMPTNNNGQITPGIIHPPRILQRKNDPEPRNNQFNHSENSPFKKPMAGASTTPTPSGFNIQNLLGHCQSGTYQPPPMPPVPPSDWLSVQDIEAKNNETKKIPSDIERLFSKLNCNAPSFLPSPYRNIKIEPPTSSDVKTDSKPLLPTPPKTWLVELNENDFDSKGPIPTMVISRTNKPPTSTNNDPGSMGNNMPNRNHHQSPRKNNYINNNSNHQQSLTKQTNYIQREPKEGGYSYNLTLNQNQTNSTRFVPLVVARNHQHDNAMRKQTKYNKYRQ